MSAGLALYQVADEYLADLEKLAEAELDPQTLADSLEAIAGDFEIKATNVAFFIKNRVATIAAIKDAEKQLAARRKTAEARNESFTSYLIAHMQRTGITKIEGPMLRLSLRANPGALVIDDELQIPEFFWKQPAMPPKEIDMQALKQAIAEGEDIPGARIVKGTRLEIKN